MTQALTRKMNHGDRGHRRQEIRPVELERRREVIMGDALFQNWGELRVPLSSEFGPGKKNGQLPLPFSHFLQF